MKDPNFLSTGQSLNNSSKKGNFVVDLPALMREDSYLPCSYSVGKPLVLSIGLDGK